MELSIQSLRRSHYWRYVLASVASLGADLLVFVSALDVSIPAVSSAVAGYMAGLFTHWMLSSRFVFSGATRPRGAERTRQKILFVASALAGLGITTGVVGWGLRWGLDPRTAKLIAICISFQATYVIRSRLIFS